MMTIRMMITLCAVALLTACAQTGPVRNTGISGSGTVTDMQFMAGGGGGNTTGGGAVVGAIVGGVIGHQMGGGRGRDVATVAGAVGGGLIGNEVERSNNSQGGQNVRITVRLDDGRYYDFQQAVAGDIRVGDRVRVNNGFVSR